MENFAQGINGIKSCFSRYESEKHFPNINRNENGGIGENNIFTQVSEHNQKIAKLKEEIKNKNKLKENYYAIADICSNTKANFLKIGNTESQQDVVRENYKTLVSNRIDGSEFPTADDVLCGSKYFTIKGWRDSKIKELNIPNLEEKLKTLEIELKELKVIETEQNKQVKTQSQINQSGGKNKMRSGQ